MAKIITVAHQKGGVGKTTLALLLAYTFNGNLKVGVLDYDMQGSITNLKAEGISTISYKEWDIDLVKDYDLIIIDTPPYLSKNLHDVFLMSDFVLVPTKAGFVDILAIQGTLKLLEKVKEKKPRLKTGIVFNMVKPNSSIVKEVISACSSFNIPIFKTLIYDRVSYTRSVITGGILKSNNTKAINEILSLCNEILEFLEA